MFRSRYFLVALTAGIFTAIAGCISPVTRVAEAESTKGVWLILRYGHVSMKGNSAALEKIKMSSMSQCQLMGSQYASTEKVKNEHNFTIFGFNCIES